jgi:hypothetical protein
MDTKAKVVKKINPTTIIIVVVEEEVTLIVREVDGMEAHHYLVLPVVVVASCRCLG